IAFPPLPVGLDFEVWMKASGLLYDLERSAELVRASLYEDGWDERFESLVERVRIDGEGYLELSAAGQSFHDTFRERVRSARDRVLPPPAPPGQKKEPRCDHGHVAALRDLRRYLERLTAEVGPVVHCGTIYHHPGRPDRNGFRLGSKGIEGTW